MNPFSRIGRWFRNKLSTPDVANEIRPTWLRSAGVLVSKDTALQVPAVFGCIWRITNALAPHPWEIYEVEGRRRTLRPIDPLVYLLNTRPNPSTTALAFRQAMLSACMAGDGNSYAEIQRDGRGQPAALWPLEPERVEPHSQADGTMFYRVHQYSGGQVDVEASRIYHLRGFASVNGMVGDGLIYRASGAISIALAAQQFAAGYYANGTISSGALKMPKGSTLGTKTIDRLRAEWREKHSGAASAYAPIFLEDGMEWENLSPDADKSQLHSARTFSVEEIARFFGVPLHLLGVAQSAQGYGTNVEQLGIEFVKYTLAPWAAALQQEADFKLCPSRGPVRVTEIDLSSLTQGDSKAQAEAFSILRKSGILNQNEIRSAMGWNDAGPDGDVYMVEGTLATAENVINDETWVAPDPKESPAPAGAPKPAGEPAPKPGAKLDPIAKGALVAFYASALERYAKRIANRRADLQHNAPDKVEANLSAEREKVRPAVVAEVAPASELLVKAGVKAPNGDLLAFLDAVEQGEPARLAAERLLSSLLEAA